MRAGKGEFLFWQAELGAKEDPGRPAPRSEPSGPCIFRIGPDANDHICTVEPTVSGGSLQNYLRTPEEAQTGNHL
jgi:hypothetical protein